MIDAAQTNPDPSLLGQDHAPTRGQPDPDPAELAGRSVDRRITV